jgi:hypothetical protein
VVKEVVSVIALANSELKKASVSLLKKAPENAPHLVKA